MEISGIHKAEFTKLLTAPVVLRYKAPLCQVIGCGSFLDGDINLNRRSDTSALVRNIRVQLGLTQEKLAARLGVTFPTINRWENGRAKPSPLALRQIEDLLTALGKDGDDLRSQYFPKKAI